MNELIPCDLCGSMVPEHLYSIHIIICGILQNRLYEPIIIRQYYHIPPVIPVLEKTECPICYEHIKDKCRELYCGHVFCVNCIDTWWNRQEYIKSCPYCKTELQKYTT